MDRKRTHATAFEQISSDDAKFVAALKEPSTRPTALNDLLKVTSSYDMNYALSSGHVLQELAAVGIEFCLEYKLEKLEDPMFRSKETWKEPPARKDFFDLCQRQLHIKTTTLPSSKLHMLEAVLVILRNLSYLAANLRLMAYSPTVLLLLSGCLYDHTTREGSIGLQALQALVHLSSYLDVSGQKLVADKLFYARQSDGPVVPDADSYGLTVDGSWGMAGLWLAKRLDTREDTISNISMPMLMAMAGEQLVGVWSIFSGLMHLMTSHDTSRSALLGCMELLQEAINSARVGVVGSVQREDKPQEIPKIRTVLVSMPDSLLERLVDCLFIPRNGPDSLSYINPAHQPATRISAMRLMTANYETTVDTEIRDRALDILQPLLELDSPRMAQRLGQYSTLWNSLVPILTTSIGKADASSLASQIMRELNRAPENRTPILALQDRLVELASRNMRVSQLVWNHLYRVGDETMV